MLQRPRQFAQTLLAWTALAALLAGCTPGMLERSSEEFESLRAEASELEAAGDWTAAAEAWQKAAEATRGATRDEAMLAAAEAWLRAGDPERADASLAALPDRLDPRLEARLALAEARLLMQQDRPAEAHARLADVPAGPGDPAASAVLATRADAAFASRQPAKGVADLVRREALLSEPGQRASNQRRIWNRMQEASAARIELATPAGADPIVAAWLELGRAAAASGGNPFRLHSALVGWRQRHPSHPAAAGVVETLLAEYRAMTDYPRRVALLLPLSGRQAAAASVVRDGFIAAYLAQGHEGERPRLQVYDSAALGPTGAYEQAVTEGADFVVGPLLKEELAELAGAQLPTVPTLALNWADEGVLLPGEAFQFALAPEDEAAAAARRAALDGHRRAIALVHDSEQGRRMADSFINAFRNEGGEVLAWQVYDPRESDFSIEITGLLLIDESRARHQRIQSALGRRLEYEPRRRQDADFLFLAARPSEALQIRPQLRFHYASTLPVYSTSAIYDAGRSDNADLDGVLFADMPWRVGAQGNDFMRQFRTFGPAALDRDGRLYAFGADAYRLVPLLHNRSERLAAGVEGLTGVLTISGDGRIHRDPDWGRFIQGRVRHDPPARPEIEEPEPPDS
jgi:uncharacterized protein